MTGKVKMERRSAAAHRQGNGELVIATSIVDLFVSVGADVEGWGEPYRHQRTHAVSARVDATAQAFQQAAPAALTRCTGRPRPWRPRGAVRPRSRQ